MVTRESWVFSVPRAVYRPVISGRNCRCLGL